MQINKKAILSSFYSPSKLLGFPAEFEQTFRDEYYRSSIVMLRVAAVLSIGLYSMFGLLDFWAIPQSLDLSLPIRAAVVSVFALAIGSTFIPAFHTHAAFHFPNFMSLGALLAGVGLITISSNIEVGDPGRLSYDMGLILIVFFTYTFCRLFFAWATVTSLILLITYEIVTIIYQDPLSSQADLIAFITINAFLISANLIGMFACYYLELCARRDYMQRQQIEAEKAKADNLLLNILPKEIAATLKESSNQIADEFSDATILFADIGNFTPLSEKLSAQELVSLLNDIFAHFDDLAEKFGLEKIKTIGDCYMVAAGIPVPRDDHAHAATAMAIKMRDFIQSETFHGHQLEMRIGLHSGPVVAGVIGKRKFIYDVWGDTVNISSRMESHGALGQIQISRATWELVGDDFSCESRGAIKVKGKGDMEAWFVLNAND